MCPVRYCFVSYCLLCRAMALDLSKVQTRTINKTLNPYNLVVVENHGLDGSTGFWWLVFTFDHRLEKGIEVRLTNFKYGGEKLGRVWTLEVVKCSYLGITSKKEMASFDMTDELINGEELGRLQECAVSNENLRQYLETNVVPLVTKKIKYTRFTPQFSFFLSHKSQDKPLMNTFENGLKFLGYKTWVDRVNMPMAANLPAALKTSIESSDCLLAWLNKEYMQSEYCRAELLYAKKLGKIILPFGTFDEVREYMTGEFEFLRHFHVYNPKEASFFEMLRRIDDTLFNFETLAI